MLLQLGMFLATSLKYFSIHLAIALTHRVQIQALQQTLLLLPTDYYVFWAMEVPFGFVLCE